MTDQKDYRLYLDNRFDSITQLVDDHFESIKDTLNAIEKQTTKTNGRVTELESAVNCLEKDIIRHPAECPKGKIIDKIEDDLEEYRIFKKYPKWGIIILLFTILVFFGGIWKLFDVLAAKTENVVIETMHKQKGYSSIERNGTVVFNNKGLTDSINIYEARKIMNKK